MPTMRFTAAAIDRLSVEKETLFWDTNQRGFGLRVQPSGKKVFVFQYTFQGQTRRLTIGELGRGGCTLSWAEREARKKIGLVAEGEDPARSDVEHATVAELSEKWLDLHVRVKRKTSTIRDYEELVRNHLLPRFGKLHADSLRRVDVMEMHRALEDRSRTANKVVVVLKAMYNFGIKAELLPDGFKNPAAGVELYGEEGRERYLTADELGRVGSAIVDLMEEGKVSVWAGNALRLLMLTGCRLNEVLTLKWEYISFAQSVVSLPDTKTGARRVELSPAALSVLSDMPRLKGHPYVFVGQRPGDHLVTLRVPWLRVCEKAGIEACRIHDLRHTFASVAAMGGLSLPMIGKLLGHKVAATTARYAHLADEASRRANDTVSGEIGRALGLGASSENVVAMRGRS